MDYDAYNREERYLCSHLFRLLHEPADDYSALRTFLKRRETPGAFRIYAEVALIRDAYYARRPDVVAFMDGLVQMIIEQEGVTTCRLYSELPEPLSNCSCTNPSKFMEKTANLLGPDERRVYRAMQGIFNAKPDLAICIGDELIVFEAKLTMQFDAQQLQRTYNIGAVWAQLLFADLGYARPPQVTVHTLGFSKARPDASWEEVSHIADGMYSPQDRTRAALARAVHLV